ncbi:bifunctional folylpolyglutamate synthase/dihydrofolate synthase [Streptococcus marmotae]|uniref:bifunctional folylpolyglutamate synthase/dihydrofolate synthase n=1 Tax=Streptococcus marmotae TaxID=1825069 RepID=UPI000835D7FC|nr:folylpolyglutamate synthase/dihydrofolate synthase family protein [Streptococcus marmotae]
MTLEKWLNEKQGRNYRYKMEKVRYALDLLGHPEQGLPVVHVAGTNGKGSTIAFLRSLLEGHNLRVGTFVSPHLVTVHDRICINGQPIAKADFQKLLERVFQLEKKVEQVYEPFRYFEVLTLVMLLYFQAQRLDIALVEVGIGGLLDTTNVVEPLISIITSIGLDHQDLLGNSLTEIAEQKAGIIKEKAPIILGPMPDVALQICKKTASAHHAPLYYEGRDFVLMNGQFRSDTWQIEGIELGLIGQHQEENAALALQAFYLLMNHQDIHIDQEEVLKTLKNTQWAGRLERIGGTNRMYLDGAHNLPAIERLVDFVQSQQWNRVTILFSALKRKDFREMLDSICERLPEARLILTSFAYDGGIDELDAPKGIPYIADYVQFIQEWERQSLEGELLFITGSLYFIAEVRKAIEKNSK